MTRTEIIERDVSFGPFKTEHHNRTVDSRFRRSFFSFLQDRVLPSVDGNFTRAEGRLWSYYDDPKYFGPLSILRFRYFYEIGFHSPEGLETATGEIDYNPATSMFGETRIRPLHVDSLVLQRKRRDMMEKVMVICDLFRKGQREFSCPYCGSLLSIWYLKERDFLKDIRCPTKDCLRIHFD